MLVCGSIFQAAQQDLFLRERVTWFAIVLKQNNRKHSIDNYKRIYQESPLLLRSKLNGKSMLQISEEAGNHKATRAFLELVA